MEKGVLVFVKRQKLVSQWIMVNCFHPTTAEYLYPLKYIQALGAGIFHI
jgi:hypothetical protein